MSKFEEMLVAAYHEIESLAWEDADSDTQINAIRSILYQVEQNLDHLTSESKPVE